MTDNNDDLIDALQHLIAIERDRMLGYPTDELHMHPKEAIKDGLGALQDHGVDPADVVWEDDRELLDIDLEDL